MLVFGFIFQDFVYDLGCGMKTTNPEEAGELLMKREYPEILNCQGKDHDYLFIPDTFMYEELTTKVETDYSGFIWQFIVFQKMLSIFNNCK